MGNAQSTGTSALDWLRSVLVDEHGWEEQDRGSEIVFQCFYGRLVVSRSPTAREMDVARREMALCEITFDEIQA